ncbi:MAG TPA: amidohydrolase family protein [Jatrophihabitantaceae bacterium]|jgi:imidazolonepropionase-like amidohydrolase|nr:amidohydrolase family protein [Jatrophihabitantaceae bacterium]
MARISSMVAHTAVTLGRAARERAGSVTDALRARREPPAGDLGRGVALMGTVWPGGDREPFPGVVIIDGDGTIDYLGVSGPHTVPAGLPVLGGAGYWIGPGIVDAHVHLSFASVQGCLRAGLVGVRDLGAPADLARLWRTGHRRPTGQLPVVATAGQIITAPGGYPSRSWGENGFAAFAHSPSQARQLVQGLAASGVDLIKIALEPGERASPVLGPRVVAALVATAHDAGLSVTAHALSVEMIRRAIDAGVDELAHTPTERLPEQLVDQIAAAGIGVVSTLQTFFSAGGGRSAADNAADLYRAGVRLRYGTDLGNAGTLPGVDPRELDRLADTGMGRLGALRAATEYSAQAPGIRGRTGLLRVGQQAALVLLNGDPLSEPVVWRSPRAVVADGRLLLNEPV